MIFRLSQKLNAKIKAGTLAAMPVHENPFADWSAHVFVAGRSQYVLLSNTRSLFSTLLPGKGVTTASRFIERASCSIRELLEDDGCESAYERFIAPVSGPVRFATAIDRSVTGSLNDLIRQATAWLTGGDLPLHDVGIKLNDILLSSLARSKSVPYGTPREAFKELVRSIQVEAE